MHRFFRAMIETLVISVPLIFFIVTAKNLPFLTLFGICASISLSLIHSISGSKRKNNIVLLNILLCASLSNDIIAFPILFSSIASLLKINFEMGWLKLVLSISTGLSQLIAIMNSPMKGILLASLFVALSTMLLIDTVLKNSKESELISLLMGGFAIFFLHHFNQEDEIQLIESIILISSLSTIFIINLLLLGLRGTKSWTGILVTGLTFGIFLVTLESLSLIINVKPRKTSAEPISIILSYILYSNSRMILIIYWFFISSFVIIYVTHYWTASRKDVIGTDYKRKFFHVGSVLMFIPGLLMNNQVLTHLALTIAFVSAYLFILVSLMFIRNITVKKCRAT